MRRLVPKLLWLLVAIQSPEASAFFGGGPCPDFETGSCLDRIRSLIDATSYADARDAADEQCFGSPSVHPGERLASGTLLTQASGCFYLYSIERFLGRQARAFEAKERARRIATFGCEQGMTRLCDLQIGFVRSQLADLVAELSREAKGGRVKGLGSVTIKDVRIPRSLPRSFQKELTETLKTALAPHLEGAGKGPTLLDASLSLEGPDLALMIAVREKQSGRVLYRETFQTDDIRERYETFGFNALTSKEATTARHLNAYVPDTKTLVGLGVARIPNLSGDTLDHGRFNLQIRAMERFRARRSEFGILLSIHSTYSTFVKREDREAPEGKPKPYGNAFTVYGIYNHMLIDKGDAMASLRHSVNVAVGGMVAQGFLAGSARLGWDLHLGRSWVVSFGAVGIGESKTLIDEELKTTPASYGTDFILSMNL